MFVNYKKMNYFFLLVLSITISIKTFAQLDTVSIAAYNILNYPNTTNEPLNIYREANYRIALADLNPDILICEEVKEIAGGQRFLDSVLKKINPDYTLGTIINNPINGETENAVFYKASKFAFINNIPIHTTLRDINEFQMQHSASLVNFSLFAVHLKASNTPTDIDRRRMELDSLRKVTNAKAVGHNSVVLGDFNMYSSNEAGYINILQDQIVNDGEFYDPYVMTGTFNKLEYAAYHTQSPRIDNYSDGGAGGGCDDRFDMILNSEAVLASGGMKYLPGSCVPFGNDGNHYNDSINTGINTMVGNTVATALIHSSDHLPVLSKYSFSNVLLPVNFISIKANEINDALKINWTVSDENEINNYEIQYSYDLIRWRTLAEVKAQMNDEYQYISKFNFENKNYFRIKAKDINDGFYFSSVIKLNSKELPTIFAYPNPASNLITLSSNSDYEKNIEIIDEIGKVIATYKMENSLILDISSWNKGIYFITNNGSGITKFMKN